MSKRIVRREINQSIENLTNTHPVVQRIYAARNICHADELNRELSGLLPFSDLLGVDKAIQRLHEALKQQLHVMIVGDFDADGATSTTLAVSALRAFGLRNVSYLVPNRFTYGYGLTPEIVDVAAEKNPDIIITVDNGIASHAGVARANELGMQVIVTDHHLPGDDLPDAYAIVNPNQPGDSFKSKCLAGVGVIFYLMLALRSYLKEQKWFEEQGLKVPNMGSFLDLVALGTVADVVPLDQNNRIMVHQGLKRMKSGKMRPGIAALLEVAGRDPKSLSAMDLGFTVGPRLNAAGRIDDMSLGITCLLADNKGTAKKLAQKLDQLNRERRAIEVQMQKEAFNIVDELNLSKSLPFGLCLYDEGWHQGVVGLVASRVKERVHRPVIAFAKTDEGQLKGSARSVPGLHIRDALDNIATEHPEVLSKFGGHAMAAGLSIAESDFKQFNELFSAEVRKHLTEDQLCGIIETDGELGIDDFTLQLAELLAESGPWGQGFPAPLFDGVFKLYDQRIVGRRHLKLLIRVPQTDHYVDAIAFNVDLDKWPNSRCESAHLAYRLDVNEYNGRRSLQLIVEELQPCTSDVMATA